MDESLYPVPFPYEQETEWPAFLEEREPDAQIATGTDDGSMASLLAIFYVAIGDETWTYVSSRGEAENAMPWCFKGRVEPNVVLAEYLGSGEAAEGLRTWESVYGPNTPEDW